MGVFLSVEPNAGYVDKKQNCRQRAHQSLLGCYSCQWDLRFCCCRNLEQSLRRTITVNKRPAKVVRFSVKRIFSLPGPFLDWEVSPTHDQLAISPWWTWTSRSCWVAMAAVRAASRGRRRYRCSLQEVCVCVCVCLRVCV